MKLQKSVEAQMVVQDQQALDLQYRHKSEVAERLLQCLKQELTTIIDRNGIALGVPVETRVKTLSSITDKLEAKADYRHLDDLDDIAGMRIILLFSRDADKLDVLIRESLDIISHENRADRLSDDRFGYQSNHYIVRIPQSWASVPSYYGLDVHRAEIQVRTLSQHTWAAASHKLQYKREGSVPAPLRRAINRVSALLETVDLEFERLLVSRESYEADLGEYVESDTLDVDLFRKILAELYPKKNGYSTTGYEELLIEFEHHGITTAGLLKSFITNNVAYSLERDSFYVEQKTIDPENLSDAQRANIANGVYFSHIGLARIALQHVYDDE